ncbi:MAG: MerR family transcriptional regulator [Acidiferrobacteraceae bacterium]|jgi:DNA-binding transcriptional MerR regulator|nr:MerR family transcriptional regulator [Acidiferrobacteraceae bacterium]|tara:strand:- start:50888 stop:51265 length:378 start_codon:yes stop_codon:yes gene_type:complete
MTELLTISELAEEFAITTRTIRFYEDEGLLQPKRNGRQRIYSRRDRLRLSQILRVKGLGLSLSEISEILNLYDLDQDNKYELDRLLQNVRQRRNILKQKRNDIDATLIELKQIEQRCKNRIESTS